MKFFQMDIDFSKQPDNLFKLTTKFQPMSMVCDFIQKNFCMNPLKWQALHF